jgi:WD40 repeat protein
VRKLIGHSGPVYSLSFDPLGGTVAPPQHLLSSSQDGTVRLWGLETYKNLVVYKGHTDPVWAVEWGPLGAYFATASRDRTARLWVTDRVTPLRMFAGHLSDVDVSPSDCNIAFSDSWHCSVSNSTPTRYTLQPDRATKRVDCGMCNAENVSECSLAIMTPSTASPSVRTVDILLAHVSGIPHGSRQSLIATAHSPGSHYQTLGYDARARNQDHVGTYTADHLAGFQRRIIDTRQWRVGLYG